MNDIEWGVRRFNWQLLSMLILAAVLGIAMAYAIILGISAVAAWVMRVI